MKDLKPDVEAKITFLTPEDGGRISPVCSGYRPTHLVRDDYLSTGEHQYYGKDEVEMGETVLGTITLISPEFYPNCLWIGKQISVQEGSYVIGYAEITKIFNETLLKQYHDL